MTTIDKEGIAQAYEDVRSDSSETSWAVFSYEEKNISVSATGSDYDEFLSNFSDDKRLYAYIRVYSGDEMSKRAKFVFIAWCGSEVKALQKAKISVDKSLVKSVVKNFAVEILTEEKSEIQHEAVLEIARKAGGANYGTGTR